jgi:asparaginyl-tRNA synthetase
MQTISIKEALEVKDKETISIVGWIKSNRDSGKIGFIELNDGSTVKNLQIVYKQELTKGFEQIKNARTGAAILAIGQLQTSTKSKQQHEIIAAEIKLLKQAHEDYPLQKKQHSNEFLREIAHLRVRTTTTSAIMKVRSKLAYAIHSFFQDNDFI